MAKPLHLLRVNLLFRRRPNLPTTATPPRLLRHFSVTLTRYPLDYEMIIYRAVVPPPRPKPLRRSLPPNSDSSFESFVDRRLTPPPDDANDGSGEVQMDKSKRRYLNKRKRKLLGSDSEDEEYRKRHEDELIELRPEIVEFKSMSEREEEIFFYDAFAYPWEQKKHYRMMYQLEHKFFPGQGFDKAFLDPVKQREEQRKARKGAEKGVKKGEEEGLMFFEQKGEKGEKGKVEDVEVAVVSEKKAVGEFFKGLKRGSNEDDQDVPFISSRKTGLPARWDSPEGVVLLVNKPKGWTSFTVCGKLRSLVKVKKVGHAGTLDPMATGLLIVCVGKATKIVDRFQGMIKGYSGIIRLGEATSTWDADSPVIQREPWEHIKDADLKKAARSFYGEIWQVPPMFSAIKVGGERMYEKARRGENIELAPRRVSIFRFEIERSLDDRQNLIFRVTCSKGTYIRSLCADLGKALGSCAHLTALRRDSIGEYLSADAWDFKELEEDITKGYM